MSLSADPPIRDPARPYRVAVLLAPGFSHLALELVTEPLFVANWAAQRTLFAWRTYSADGLAVPTSSGGAVPVDAPLGSEPADLAVVLASFEARRAAADPRLLAWLRRAARAGTALGAIETGSEILAAAGLLGGAEIPVHWYNLEGFRERHPDVAMHPGRARLAPRLAISAGGLATMDLMLALIAREAGADLADEVARQLLAAPAAPALPSPEGGDPADRALALLRSDDPPGPEAVARAVGLSLRQLQRRFQSRHGLSLGRAARDLRMARAHQLVQQTDLSIAEIGVACGFAAPEAFSRAYRARFGVAPSRDRGQSTRSSVLRATLPPA